MAKSKKVFTKREKFILSSSGNVIATLFFQKCLFLPQDAWQVNWRAGQDFFPFESACAGMVVVRGWARFEWARHLLDPNPLLEADKVLDATEHQKPGVGVGQDPTTKNLSHAAEQHRSQNQGRNLKLPTNLYSEFFKYISSQTCSQHKGSFMASLFKKS